MKKFYFCQFALLLFANFNVVRTSVLQCADSSDFQCLNAKKCIPRFFVCNGMDECGDGSDEVHCNDMFGDAESNSLIKAQCSSNQFRCGDGVCVLKSAVCDGRNDCLDNSDELHCKRPNQECKGFECGNLCIPAEYVCDGEPDCNDGLDELNCGPDAFMNHTCLIEHGFFPCKGSRSRCIPIRRVCDGYVDCEHGTDENGRCNKTSCSGFGCDHGCTQTPEGPHCLCKLGFRADNTKCIDIDECEIDPPRCSQLCTNTPGSYKCSCLPGYTLHDNRSCVANKSEPVLLLTTTSEASALYTRSRLFVRIYSKVNNPQSIDMDNEQGYVYWTESLSDGAGIVRSTINGHGLERVVASGIHQPEALVVDWVGRHVYFTDSYFKHIVVCDITGLYCATVVAKGLDRPRGIAVEPESRLMFWTDVSETQPHIGRSGMDGSNPVRIVRTELSQPSSVAVDPIVKRIFWCDSGLDRLESSSFDGTSRRLIHSLVSHPMSVDVFEDWLYWSDPKEHQVKRCNKFNGKHVEVLMSEYGLSPLGIRVAHPIRQMQQINSACWGVVCSHLCLLSPTSPSNYTCACPGDMSLGLDGKTCQRDNKMASLVVATMTELFQLHPYQIGREMTHRLPPHILENIGAVAYDQRTHSLVYSDIGARVIYRLDLASYNQSTLFTGIDAVEGLDVDEYSGSVYWTDAGRGTFAMANPVTGKSVVLARGLVHPGALVLAVERGEIYIAEGRSNAVIGQWTMYGVFQRILVEDIGSVSSMAYDRDSNILYWSDIQKGSISCTDVTSGTQCKVKGHIGLPVALGVSNLHLYWILQHSDRLYWTDKTSYKAIRSKQIDSAETREVSYTKMAVVEPHFSRPANYNYPCLNNGGCSHFCTPSPSGPVCLCPSGMALSEDRKACHLLVNCNADFFRCPDSKCIPESQVCDGIPDCQPSAADEMNCSSNKTGPCSPKEFRCGSGECVPLDFRCDLEFDCKDKSDEPSDCPTVHCKPFEEFSCKNQRQCIPALSHCDGESDCKDGSDEIGCLRDHDCRHDEFFCPQSKLCVSRAWRCDGSEDCEHGEDEFNCTVAVDSCPANFVRCKANEPCLPRVMLCNGVANCLHESPEQLCRSLEKPANHSVATGREADACLSGQFSCFMSWGECLPSSAKCNCVKECPRGEDEEGCPPCTSDRFKCPDENRYIETSWLCDGEADCSSGADELPGLCVKNVTEDEEPFSGIDIFVGQACSSDDFTCKNGVCVSYKVLCDGHNDCIDNTDEGRSCSNACENNGGCPHLCQKSPDGPICHCHPGYKSLNDGRQCIDINECEVDDDCAQICVNTKGSRKCACTPGYHLQADSRSCKAAEGRPFFVVSGMKSFERLLLDSVAFAASTNSHLKWTHSEQPVKDFDFTVRNSTLYWISTHSTLYASHSYNLGQALHKFSHFRASSLALDFVTGNLYVAGAADNGQSQIRVWSPAAGHEAVVYRTTGVVTDVALDPSRGLLFWAEVGQGTGRIRRSAMDGTDVQALSNSRKIVNPASLAVDAVKGRVYWADVHTQTISSCDFDGSRYRVDVKKTYGIPLSLTFFENRLYWTCSDQKVVQVASIGEHAVEEVAIDLAAHHILAVHSVLEPTLANPCAESECGNGLCVLTANSTHNCLCPGDWKIESVHPFRCRNSSLCPLQCNLDQKCVSVNFEWRCEPVDNMKNLPEDSVEIPSSPGVTAASIFVCLAILTVLAIAVCVYYRRCRTSVGSPLKLRFRNALGLNEESIAWDESVEYSDRKALHKKESLEPPPEVQVHDSNRNTLTAPPDSAYASQQSLARAGSTEGIAHGVQVSFPLRQKLLASEL